MIIFDYYSSYLASGSGDTTVRFWDINTETPDYTCKGPDYFYQFLRNFMFITYYYMLTYIGHKHWILAIAWSSDGEKLASGCKKGEVNAINGMVKFLHDVLLLKCSISLNILKNRQKCLFQICLWDPKTGKQIGHALIGHKQWITCLSWEPLHKFVMILINNIFSCD